MEIHLASPYIIWYILLTLLSAVIGIISYRRTFPPLARWQRVFLAALRVLMVVLLGIFLAEPVINLYSTLMIKPRLGVLVDVSRSMSVKDSDLSRIDVANKLVGTELEEIKSDYRVFTFSDDLNESGGFPDESDISGDATSISAALRKFADQRDIENYGAILIVTDGRQNLGDDPVATAIKLDIPVNTLTLGERVAEKNLSIENLIYPPVAYSGVDFMVEAEVSANGIPSGKSRMYAKLGSASLADKPFDIPQEGRKARIAFDLKAPEPGNYEYTVSTPVLDGEDNKVDNDRLFAVRVLKNKLKILLGSSSLNWEFKFIDQALSRNEEFAVDAVYPGPNGAFVQPGTPRGLDGLKDYDAIILVNCPPSSLRISPLDLKNYIDDGGSLVYICGDKSANDVKLFDGVLPINPGRLSIFDGEFYFEPSPTNRQHAAIMLDEDPDQSVRLWHSLPPLTEILTGFQPTGQVLIEASSSLRDSVISGVGRAREATPSSRPILIAGIHGKGRVAAMTAFPWWRSYFGATRDPKSVDIIPEFWRNLLKWASATDQVENFKIITDRKVYRLGEPIRFTGYLYDEANRPRNGAYVSLAITPVGEETEIKDLVLPPIDNGIYSELLASLGPGHYDFAALATAHGDTFGKAAGGFAIENYSLEMSSSSPDYDLTRRISEATGGHTYSAENFNQFAGDLKLDSFSREKQTVIRPFGMPVLIGILLAGLCLEWGLRKRYRLP